MDIKTGKRQIANKKNVVGRSSYRDENGVLFYNAGTITFKITSHYTEDRENAQYTLKDRIKKLIINTL